MEIMEPAVRPRCSCVVRPNLGLAALLALAAVVALFVGGGAAADPPLLAVVQARPTADAALARIEARTLKTIPPTRVSLGRNTGGWSFSPDGSKLAIGSWSALGLRIVDTRTLRVLRDVSTPNGSISFAAWLTPRKIVGWEGIGSFAVDAVAGKLLGSDRVDGTLVDAQAARESVVVLLASAPAPVPAASAWSGCPDSYGTSRCSAFAARVLHGLG